MVVACVLAVLRLGSCPAAFPTLTTAALSWLTFRISYMYVCSSVVVVTAASAVSRVLPLSLVVLRGCSAWRRACRGCHCQPAPSLSSCSWSTSRVSAAAFFCTVSLPDGSSAYNSKHRVASTFETLPSPLLVLWSRRERDCGNNHMGRGVRVVWVFQSFLIRSCSDIERVHQDEVEQGYMKHGRKNKWDKLHKKTWHCEW